MPKSFAAGLLAGTLSLGLATTALAQAVVRTADPVKRGYQLSDFPRMEKIADNIYVYQDFHAGAEKFTTNAFIVTTPDGVFVADAQGSVEATQGMLAALRKITDKPIKYVAICSDHGDHTAGNAAFPAGIHYFVNPTSKAILDKQHAARPASWTVPADAELVTSKKTVTLGGEEFQILFLGPTHTGGDLDVYMPKRKILFTSETFLNRIFPAMRSAHPSSWLHVLDKIEKMDVDLYIPGHGFVEKPAVSKEELRAYHQALQAVVAEATRLYKAGVPVDEAVKQANFGEYAGWTLASSQAPIAVRKVYEELSGKLGTE